jgi:hypothetical protein
MFTERAAAYSGAADEEPTRTALRCKMRCWKSFGEREALAMSKLEQPRNLQSLQSHRLVTGNSRPYRRHGAGHLVETQDVGRPHRRADYRVIGAVDNKGLAEGVDLPPSVVLGEHTAQHHPLSV